MDKPTVKLYQADMLNVTSFPLGARLVYMDPPFFTQENHRLKNGVVAFYDKWRSAEDFINYLELRISHIPSAFQDRNASFVLHCDPRLSHRLRLVCDDVFRPENFADEIVWSYKRWPTKTNRLQRFHDVLIRYTGGGNRPVFNQLYEPLSASTIARFGASKQQAQFKDGQRQRSEATTEQSPGMPLGDVWDIPIIAPRSKERTGYPTQKPEALIERLVLLYTNPGDTVLDVCCGSGTTLAVAARLGRNAIGIDIGEDAILMSMHRLKNMGITPSLYFAD
jgi:hypothetical protein